MQPSDYFIAMLLNRVNASSQGEWKIFKGELKERSE